MNDGFLKHLVLVFGVLLLPLYLVIEYIGSLGVHRGVVGSIDLDILEGPRFTASVVRIFGFTIDCPLDRLLESRTT